MNLERLDQLNTELDALEAQDNALNAELSSASEYERSQIRSQKSNLNNQRVRLWQEKEALKKTLLRDAQNAVVAAEMALRHCTERAAAADSAHQVVSRVMGDVDRLALEFKNALVAEMNGTAGPRERVRGNFANLQFLAFALRDVIEARLQQVADEWLVSQQIPAPEELAQVRNALTRAHSRRNQIEAI